MPLSSITVADRWDQVFYGSARTDVDVALLTYLRNCPRFAGIARTLSTVRSRDWLPLATDDRECLGLLLVDVSRKECASELYLLPVAFDTREDEGGILQVTRSDLGQMAVLRDATDRPTLWQRLGEVIQSVRRIPGQHGYAEPWRTGEWVLPISSDANGPPLVDPHPGEQTNWSATIGRRFHAKLYRRLTAGEHPELEMGRYLTEKVTIRCVPALAGAIHYHDHDGERYLLAMVHEAVTHQGDAWSWTLSVLQDILRRIPRTLPVPSPRDGDVPAEVQACFSDSMRSIERLGQRTAELHLALSRGLEPAFVPESFDVAYQRMLYDTMCEQAYSTLAMLRQQRELLPDECQTAADALLAATDRATSFYHPLVETRFAAQRIRCHGDFHLGQVLVTGTDFVIVDFEGEPDRPFEERRTKSSPLRDVAGMLRSFHYASRVALGEPGTRGSTVGVDELADGRWLDVWCHFASSNYVRAYRDAAADGGFLPDDPEQFRALLRMYTLDKAFYELRYELNHRPAWVGIPLDAFPSLMS